MISLDSSHAVKSNDRESPSLFRSSNNSHSDQRHISSRAVTRAGNSLLSMRCGNPTRDAANFDIWGLDGSTKYSVTGYTSGNDPWTGGFYTVMRISSSTSDSAMNCGSLTFQGVTLTTSYQQVTEYAVLVAFRLVNGNSATTSVDVA
jgi:hypothetical protein